MSDSAGRGIAAVLESRRAADRADWLNLWKRWPEREPTAHPGYLEALAADDEIPMCAALDEGDRGVLYPFLLRPLRLPREGSDTGYQDITGPLLGYTGPYQWGMVEADGSQFWSAFDAWARAQHVVSSFARLSLFPEDMLQFGGRMRFVQPNVVRTLQISDDALWADVDHKVRKNVQRARREGVDLVHDPGCTHLDEFERVYLDTMRRRQASDRHFLSRRFFEKLIAELNGAVQLFLARARHAIVAAELVICSTNHAYSFLGGTSASAFGLRPNDLLKYEMARTLRDQGLTHFVLGGGPVPGDSIYRYKRSFAPTGVVDFHVGEKVHDQSAYDEMVRRRAAAEGPSWRPDVHFFPTYRSP